MAVTVIVGVKVLVSAEMLMNMTVKLLSIAVVWDNESLSDVVTSVVVNFGFVRSAPIL